MRETVDVMRRLLNMERVTFHGEFHHVDGIELDVVHGRREPRNIPIMIGATGDQMMELTGEIADGAVLNYCVPPEYNDRALELLDKGLKKSGRKLEDFDRPQLVVCSVDQDHDKAIDTPKCSYASTLPNSRTSPRPRASARRLSTRSNRSLAGLPPRSRSIRPSIWFRMIW